MAFKSIAKSLKIRAKSGKLCHQFKVAAKRISLSFSRIFSSIALIFEDQFPLQNLADEQPGSQLDLMQNSHP
jgi:hypothetical protein